MEVGGYTLHRPARNVLYQLDPDERTRVLESLASLVETPATEWPPERARRLPGQEPPLYLVPIDDSLRAFVQTANGHEPEVVDIDRRERIEFFAKIAANCGH